MQHCVFSKWLVLPNIKLCYIILYCYFFQALLPEAVQVNILAKIIRKGAGAMKNLIKWVKAIELNLLFVTFVFEKPISETIARVSGKENDI